MELKQKGANAVVGGFKRMNVSLTWTAAVDLDLMAFYKRKDGTTGGLYSPNYKGGSLGDLDAFPFMRLSGDAGLGATAGDNRETLQIVRLGDLTELYIVAINFTDAVAGTGRVFADYDARVEVASDTGDKHVVSLDSTESGSVAVLCKFTSDFMGASLINDSEVMDFQTFQERIPGAFALQLSTKIVLKQKGQKALLTGNDFHAVMRWKASVDMDLHCFYRLSASGREKKKSILGKLFKSGSGDGHVYFFKRGSKRDWPWIFLDQDAGVGDVGGDNEENLYFTDLTKLEHALIAVNIYDKPDANFASYDAVVTVRGGGREIEVPLIDSSPGNWCAIARINNVGGESGRQSPQLINVNQTLREKPRLDDFVEH